MNELCVFCDFFFFGFIDVSPESWICCEKLSEIPIENKTSVRTINCNTFHRLLEFATFKFHFGSSRVVDLALNCVKYYPWSSLFSSHHTSAIHWSRLKLISSLPVQLVWCTISISFKIRLILLSFFSLHVSWNEVSLLSDKSL